MSEKVVIVGPCGGREHALGWRLEQEGCEVFFTGGNTGTAQVGENLPDEFNCSAAIGVAATARMAKQNADMVLVAPDNPLADGAVDVFEAYAVPVFGPTKAAAKLEWSKGWAGQFERRYGLPCAQDLSFMNPQEAVAQLDRGNYVVKDDGLAFGKGVEAEPDHKKLAQKIYEIARRGGKIILQERLIGRNPGKNNEVSFFAVCDGEHALMLPYCRDYKRVDDAERGENTGGMGCFTPLDDLTSQDMQIIEQQIIMPTLIGMQMEGRPFKGVLYGGVMLTADGPKLFEFNVRFGDPEAQILMLMLNERFIDILHAAVRGELENRTAKAHDGAAISVALASAGYPGDYEKGKVIHGLDSLPSGVHAFHAGTRREGDHIVTDGGRVVHLATRAKNIIQARQRVYASIGQNGVHFEGMHHRQSIGLAS